MKNPDLMTDEEIAAELNAYAGPVEPAGFNNGLLLTVTNPERLLGLTPKEAIALAEHHGACGGAVHNLQINANRSAGGWGEILRSPHLLGWFGWLAHACEGVPPELACICRMVEKTRAALEAENYERLGKIKQELTSARKAAYAARLESVHSAQTAFLQPLIGGQTMTLVQMDQELRRLAEKLSVTQSNPAYAEWTMADVNTLLMEDEKPAAQVYLLTMRRAAENARICEDNATAFYRRDKETSEAHRTRRLGELQELLAQYLLACSIQLQKAPVDNTSADS